MSENNHTPVVGATIANAAVSTRCAGCDTELPAGSQTFQALGVPGLYCSTCGMQSLTLEPDEPPARADDDTAPDIIQTLRQEYELRSILGWSTPPAVLVLDPDEGPIWRVGVVVDDETDLLARGELNGDRLEVTLYQPFHPVDAP